ncbi:SOS response-associated peptidase family protein [Mesorhizobium sp. VNQ89]|uniref:SOS response-associated peptidase family protein n=1 Tax=Mesorhizobium quangtriensis TaxID=3157709 RepID=UPI0032B7023E
MNVNGCRPAKAKDDRSKGWYANGTQPFSFAGLWVHNDNLDVTRWTIITMPASEPMSELHDRQPAIVAPNAYGAWLSPSTPLQDVKLTLSNNLEGGLQFHRVDRRGNASSRIDKPNDDATMGQSAMSVLP